MADETFYKDDREEDDVKRENKKLLLEILENCQRKDYKRHNVLMLGESGSGKSSIINTVLKVVIGKYILRALPGAGDVVSNTLNLLWYQNCGSREDDFESIEQSVNLEEVKGIDGLPENAEVLFKELQGKLPDLFDAAGMKSSENTKEMLRLIIGGYIQPDENIAELERLQTEKGLGYLPDLYRESDPKYKISMVLFACSCTSAIPYELIKSVKAVLDEVDPNTMRQRFKSKVYLLITKYDCVKSARGESETADDDDIEVLTASSSLSNTNEDNNELAITKEQFRKKEKALAKAFVIEGVADKLSQPWVSFNESLGYDSLYVDNIALKLLRHLTTPLDAKAAPPRDSSWGFWFRKLKADVLFNLRHMGNQNIQLGKVVLILAVFIGFIAFVIFAMSGGVNKSINRSQ